jgi:hypothetical protein
MVHLHPPSHANFTGYTGFHAHYLHRVVSGMTLFTPEDAARSDGPQYHDPMRRAPTLKVPLQSVWAKIISPSLSPSELVYALAGMLQWLVNLNRDVSVCAEYSGNIQ